MADMNDDIHSGASSLPEHNYLNTITATEVNKHMTWSGTY